MGRGCCWRIVDGLVKSYSYFTVMGPLSTAPGAAGPKQGYHGAGALLRWRLADSNASRRQEGCCAPSGPERHGEEGRVGSRVKRLRPSPCMHLVLWSMHRLSVGNTYVLIRRLSASFSPTIISRQYDEGTCWEEMDRPSAGQGSTWLVRVTAEPGREINSAFCSDLGQKLASAPCVFFRTGHIRTRDTAKEH
jgi:hypothetical protein